MIIILNLNQNHDRFIEIACVNLKRIEAFQTHQHNGILKTSHFAFHKQKHYCQSKALNHFGGISKASTAFPCGPGVVLESKHFIEFQSTQLFRASLHALLI